MSQITHIFAFIPRTHKLLIAGLLLVALVAFILFVRSWLRARTRARQQAEREYIERRVALTDRQQSDQELSFTRGLAPPPQLEGRHMEGRPWQDRPEQDERQRGTG
jgi:type II secretory pathway component PulM